MVKLAGFGRYPAHEAKLAAPRDEAGLGRTLAAGSVIARGAVEHTLNCFAGEFRVAELPWR